MLSDLRHCGVRHDGRLARAWSMNTTMMPSPLDQIRQGSLGELNRRHDPASHRSLLRRKYGRVGRNNDERDDADERGKRDHESDDEGERQTTGGGRRKDDDDDERRRPQQAASPPPPPPPQIASTMTVSGVAAAPTTVVVVSTLTAPPSVSTVWMTTQVTATPSTSSSSSSSPVPTSSTVSSSSSTSTAPSNVRYSSDITKGLSLRTNNMQSVISTMFPASSSAPVPTLSPWQSIPTIDDRPRKGLNPDGDRSLTSSSALIMTATSTIWTSVIIPQTALASATALPDSDGDRQYRPQKVGQLSDLAEHLLIAAGAIGKS